MVLNSYDPDCSWQREIRSILFLISWRTIWEESNDKNSESADMGHSVRRSRFRYVLFLSNLKEKLYTKKAYMSHMVKLQMSLSKVWRITHNNHVSLLDTPDCVTALSLWANLTTRSLNSWLDTALFAGVKGYMTHQIIRRIPNSFLFQDYILNYQPFCQHCLISPEKESASHVIIP